MTSRDRARSPLSSDTYLPITEKRFFLNILRFRGIATNRSFSNNTVMLDEMPGQFLRFSHKLPRSHPSRISVSSFTSLPSAKKLFKQNIFSFQFSATFIWQIFRYLHTVQIYGPKRALETDFIEIYWYMGKKFSWYQFSVENVNFEFYI